LAGESAGSLRERGNKAVAGESRQLDHQTEGVDYIDSSGLGTLVAAHSTLCAGLDEPLETKCGVPDPDKAGDGLPHFRRREAAVDSFLPNREVRRSDILDFVKNSAKD